MMKKKGFVKLSPDSADSGKQDLGQRQTGPSVINFLGL
jgi:hypothetical protein